MLLWVVKDVVVLGCQRFQLPLHTSHTAHTWVSLHYCSCGIDQTCWQLVSQ